MFFYGCFLFRSTIVLLYVGRKKIAYGAKWMKEKGKKRNTKLDRILLLVLINNIFNWFEEKKLVDLYTSSSSMILDAITALTALNANGTNASDLQCDRVRLSPWQILSIVSLSTKMCNLRKYMFVNSTGSNFVHSPPEVSCLHVRYVSLTIFLTDFFRLWLVLVTYYTGLF